MENPDVKCGEIWAITVEIFEFVRMVHPDLSGKSACEMRRKADNCPKDIRICPDTNLVNPELFEHTAGDYPDL